MLRLMIYFWILIRHMHNIMSMGCEHTSREYQVNLRSDLLASSFEAGVIKVIDELTKIEKTETMPFKVSRSSLKFKNISLSRYILDENRSSDDFYIPSLFKSRRKKVDDPADIVMKISNPDPALACVPLKVNIVFDFEKRIVKLISSKRNFLFFNWTTYINLLFS